jgi:GNAT superfamily N-acetyltransferase
MRLTEIRKAKLGEVIRVRRDILRPGESAEVTISSVDRHPDTTHFVAILNGRIVGVASSGPEAFPFENVGSAWRLRGLAVYPEYRRTGIGSSLLGALRSHLGECGCEFWWAYARSSALQTYLRVGFAAYGGQFDLPPTGPHNTIIMQIAQPGARELQPVHLASIES